MSLQKAGIPFREVFLDKDPGAQEAFFQMLQERNVPPGGLGTPSFDVNGTLLLNNPGMSEIRALLNPT